MQVATHEAHAHPAILPLALGGCVTAIAKHRGRCRHPAGQGRLGRASMRRPPASPKPTRSAAARCARPRRSARPRGALARRRAARASRCPTDDAQPAVALGAMRYFLDTEFNGFGGALLSLALVPEDGEEFYVTLDCDGPARSLGRAQRHPYLDMVPVGLVSPRLVAARGRRRAVRLSRRRSRARASSPTGPRILTQFCYAADDRARARWCRCRR